MKVINVKQESELRDLNQLQVGTAEILLNVEGAVSRRRQRLLLLLTLHIDFNDIIFLSYQDKFLLEIEAGCETEEFSLKECERALRKVIPLLLAHVESKISIDALFMKVVDAVDFDSLSLYLYQNIDSADLLTDHFWEGIFE